MRVYLTSVGLLGLVYAAMAYGLGQWVQDIYRTVLGGLP